METINLFKAQRIVSTEPIESLTLIFDREIPDNKDIPLGEYERAFEHQAGLLADALSQILPGGTLDRLIGKLLLKKASLFIIPYCPIEREEKGVMPGE